MGSEPRVDTGEVEGVAALGEKSQVFALFEFAQANRALCSVDQALAGLESADGDGGDGRRREPHGADVPDGVVHDRALLLVEKVLALGRRRGASAAAGVESGVDCVAEDDEEGEGDDGDGGGDQIGELVGGFGGWGWNWDVGAGIWAFGDAIGGAGIGRVLVVEASIAEFLEIFVDVFVVEKVTEEELGMLFHGGRRTEGLKMEEWKSGLFCWSE